MNNRFLVGAGLSLFAFLLSAKDPVIMTVNGEDVPKSEFEYLYHKNRQQQMEPQTLEEYVEMFKLYKLKVADAKAEGIDTTSSFRREMEQYRRELAQSYVLDTVFMKGIDLSKKGSREEIRKHHCDLLAAKHSARINSTTLTALKEKGMASPDSIFVKECLSAPLSSLPLIEIGEVKKTVGDYANIFRRMRYPSPEASSSMIERAVEMLLTNELMETELQWLYDNEPDYRNLLNEYHDGSLLYEVSVRKVWDKAAKDTEGLDRFFAANKDNYSWTKPHAKGILIQAVNDTVANEVKRRMDELPGDSIITVTRKEFKGVASVERFLVEEGQNPIVDNILFGGPAVKPKGNYTSFILYNPRIINQPEELNDVRAAVTGDYQNELEARWTNELKRKYEVKVNKKELKKVK